LKSRAILQKVKAQSTAVPRSFNMQNPVNMRFYIVIQPDVLALRHRTSRMSWQYKMTEICRCAQGVKVENISQCCLSHHQSQRAI